VSRRDAGGGGGEGGVGTGLRRCDCAHRNSSRRYLHRRGIVHRDIKPENLLLTARGPEGEVKICDFGLSRLLRQEKEIIHTVCG